MAREKTVPMSWRTSPEIKMALGTLADQERRSMSSMLEWLILRRVEETRERLTAEGASSLLSNQEKFANKNSTNNDKNITKGEISGEAETK